MLEFEVSAPRDFGGRNEGCVCTFDCKIAGVILLLGCTLRRRPEGGFKVNGPRVNRENEMRRGAVIHCPRLREAIVAAAVRLAGVEEGLATDESGRATPRRNDPRRRGGRRPPEAPASEHRP